MRLAEGLGVLMLLGAQALSSPPGTLASSCLEDLGLPAGRAVFKYFDRPRFLAQHSADALPRIDLRSIAEQDRARSEDPVRENDHESRLLSRFYTFVERPVVDARLAPAGTIQLDHAGFTLVQFPTRMTPDEFYDHECVTDTYLPETEDLVKRLTGATRVLAAKYLVRNRARSDASGYVENRPHVDYTLLSAQQAVRQLLCDDGTTTDVLLSYRYQLINVWRRWDGGNEWPLACCSSSSMNQTRDLVSTEVALGAKNMLGTEVGNAVCAASHVYYYYSNMSAHEAIVFKLYDTNENVTQTCLHTAFDNSAHTTGAPPPTEQTSRASIEVRCIALFAPEQLASRARLRHRVAAPTTAVARWLVGAK